MALERWLAIASVGLFAMFAGEMYSIYNFMIDVPDDFEFAQGFADQKSFSLFLLVLHLQVYWLLHLLCQDNMAPNKLVV